MLQLQIVETLKHEWQSWKQQAELRFEIKKAECECDRWVSNDVGKLDLEISESI